MPSYKSLYVSPSLSLYPSSFLPSSLSLSLSVCLPGGLLNGHKRKRRLSVCISLYVYFFFVSLSLSLSFCVPAWLLTVAREEGVNCVKHGGSHLMPIKIPQDLRMPVRERSESGGQSTCPFLQSSHHAALILQLFAAAAAAAAAAAFWVCLLCSPPPPHEIRMSAGSFEACAGVSSRVLGFDIRGIFRGFSGGCPMLSNSHSGNKEGVVDFGGGQVEAKLP